MGIAHIVDLLIVYLFLERMKQIFGIILTILLAFIGTFIGLKVPFDRLVNIIYVINGYVGILLLVLMIIKDVNTMKEKN